MKYRISTPNERVWCTTQLAKLSFNYSIGRTHTWRFSIFNKINTIPINWLSPKSFVRTIPINRQTPKSVVRTIAISRPPYKSRVGAIPIVRDSIQNQLSGQLQFIENLRKLVVQTMPTGTNLRNQLPLQFKVIAHWLCFVKCSLMIQKRPTYKHIIIPKVDLSRPVLLMSCAINTINRLLPVTKLSFNWNCPGKWCQRLSSNWNCLEKCFRILPIN